MRRRILRWVAERTFRFAWIVALILALLTALSISGIRRLRLDTGLSDFLPPDRTGARAIGDTFLDYRNLEPIIIDIHGNEDAGELEFIDVANELANLTDNPSFFSRRVYKVDGLGQEFYDSLTDLRLIALLTNREWDYLRALMEERISQQRFEMIRARRVSAFLPRRPDRASQDPLGVLETIRNRLSRSRAPIPIVPRRGYFFSPDGRTLRILLFPVRSSDDALHALRTARFLEDVREFAYSRRPEWRGKFEIELSGSHLETAARIRRLRSGLSLIVGFSLVLVLALLILTYRKLEAIAFVLIPPVLGLVWALGLAHGFCLVTGINSIEEFGVIYTRITGVTLAFLLITFGIGLSYSIHLFNRFTYELYHNRNYYRALQRAYVDTGRGVFASAMVSALIFFSMYLTSFRGLRELGILAGVATLCNLAACLLTVPTLAALKNWMAKGKVSPIELYRLDPPALSEPGIRAPRVTIAAMLLVTVFLSIGIGRGNFETVSMKFHPRFSSIAAYLLRPDEPILLQPEANPRPGRPLVAIVEGDTIQEALERNDQLYEDLIGLSEEHGDRLGILAIDSLRIVLPSLDSQRRSLGVLKTLDLQPLEHSIQLASQRAGFQPIVFQNFLDQIRNMQQRSVSARLIEYSSAEGDALIRSVQRLVTTDREGRFRIATPIFPASEGFSHGQVDMLVQRIDPGGSSVTFVGDPIVERELSVRLRYDLALLALLCAGSIFAGLLVHFRSIRYAVLAFVPILFQGMWIFGGLNLIGGSLHLLVLMAVPLAMTLAVDNSIHLLQDYIDHGSADLRHTIATVGRSVVLTSLSMGLLYGTLSLTGFEGLRDLGMVVVFGAAAAVVGTLMLLPALIRIWGNGQPFSNIFGRRPVAKSA